MNHEKFYVLGLGKKLMKNECLWETFHQQVAKKSSRSEPSSKPLFIKINLLISLKLELGASNRFLRSIGWIFSLFEAIKLKKTIRIQRNSRSFKNTLQKSSFFDDFIFADTWRSLNFYQISMANLQDFNSFIV